MDQPSRKTSNNPLYVVTNKGKDVEEATGVLNALLKRLGLEDAVAIIGQLIKSMLEQVQSYAFFVEAKRILDQLVALLENILKMVDPVLAFSVLKR
jgi:hypothetical protein